MNSMLTPKYTSLVQNFLQNFKSKWISNLSQKLCPKFVYVRISQSQVMELLIFQSFKWKTKKTQLLSASFLPINLSSPLHSSQHKHKHPSCCIYILTHYQHISSSHGFQLLPSFWFLSFLTLVLALTLVFLSTIEPSSARVQGTSFFFFFLKIFTCLAASGISCNTQDLCVSSFVSVRGLSSCGSQAWVVAAREFSSCVVWCLLCAGSMLQCALA